jgi:hypothetical protein
MKLDLKARKASLRLICDTTVLISKKKHFIGMIWKTLACNTSSLPNRWKITKVREVKKKVFQVLEQLCSGCPAGKTSLKQRSTKKRPNVQLQER